MRKCLEVIEDVESQYNQTLQLFALYALHNMLVVPAGKAEYFNTMALQDIGVNRTLAIEKFIGSRVTVISKYVE